MRKKAFNITNIILFSLVIIFIALVVDYFIFNKDLEKATCDNAKLINTLGQIRGDTQRYVKQKILNKNYQITEQDIKQKYKIVDNLIKNNVIPKNKQNKFNQQLNILKQKWNEIKKENNVKTLYKISELHWKIADKLTSYAQMISENKVHNLRQKFKILTFIILLMIVVISFVIYLYVKKGLEQERIIDPLTKLYNRKYFEEIIKYFENEYKRYKEPFSIIFIDIDHFKQINDTFGHQKGDEVLKKVSELIIDNIRKTDFAFRYGGEEIVVIMPKTKEKDACKKTNELKSIINKKVILPNQKSVTFSAGVNEYKGGNIYDFIHKIDTLLYKAKNSGRDKIICFSSSHETHK